MTIVFGLPDNVARPLKRLFASVTFWPRNRPLRFCSSAESVIVVVAFVGHGVEERARRLYGRRMRKVATTGLLRRELAALYCA